MGMQVGVRTIGLEISCHEPALLQPMPLIHESPVEVALPVGTTTDDLLRYLEVAPTELEVLLVNGRDCEGCEPVQDGDAVLLTGHFAGM